MTTAEYNGPERIIIFYWRSWHSISISFNFIWLKSVLKACKTLEQYFHQHYILCVRHGRSTSHSVLLFRAKRPAYLIVNGSFSWYVKSGLWFSDSPTWYNPSLKSTQNELEPLQCELGKCSFLVKSCTGRYVFLLKYTLKLSQLKTVETSRKSQKSTCHNS